MGLLRVLLALSVLVEHAHGTGAFALLGGPLAVQCFFIISGFYMGLVLNERYDRPELNRTFWINRALRIYATYFAVLLLSLLFFLAVGAGGASSPLAPYADSPLPAWQKVAMGLLNLTVIGQDIPLWLRESGGNLVFTASFDPGPAGAFHFMLIPAAWSLSLELCFYAVAPFIARRSALTIASVMLASVALRALAATLGLIADPFNARFFPFELALFLAGVLAYKAWAANRAWWEAAPRRMLALAVPAAILLWPELHGDWSTELFFSPPRLALLTLVALGLPAIHGWSCNSAFDRQFGELSYPFYLLHLLVLGLMASIPGLAATPTLKLGATALFTLLLSWVVVRRIEGPIDRIRRRIAEHAGVSSQTNPGSHAPGQRGVTSRPAWPKGAPSYQRDKSESECKL